METSVATTDKDYKINNDYKPFYSRMFMAEHPKYDNFFNTRGSYADNLDWKEYVVQTAGYSTKTRRINLRISAQASTKDRCS